MSETTTGSERPKRSAWAKKAAVMAELGRLPRNGRHQDQGWTYLRGDDLFEALRSLLSKHGLVPTFKIGAIEPRQLQRKRRGQQGKEDIDDPIALIRVSVACALVDTETGEEIDVALWPAEAHDSDKAVRVATSMAIAAWLETALLVSSDDDPQGYDDDRDPPPPPRPRSQPKGPDRSDTEAFRLRSKILATVKAAGLQDSEFYPLATRCGVHGLFRDCHDLAILKKVQDQVEALARTAGGKTA